MGECSFLDRYYANRDRVHGAPRPEILGDWCDRCADLGDPRPVRFPRTVSADGVAIYRCFRCGSVWTCAWAITNEAAS